MQKRHTKNGEKLCLKFLVDFLKPNPIQVDERRVYDWKKDEYHKHVKHSKVGNRKLKVKGVRKEYV